MFANDDGQDKRDFAFENRKIVVEHDKVSAMLVDSRHTKILSLPSVLKSLIMKLGSTKKRIFKIIDPLCQGTQGIASSS